MLPCVLPPPTSFPSSVSDPSLALPLADTSSRARFLFSGISSPLPHHSPCRAAEGGLVQRAGSALLGELASGAKLPAGVVAGRAARRYRARRYDSPLVSRRAAPASAIVTAVPRAVGA